MEGSASKGNKKRGFQTLPIEIELRDGWRINDDHRTYVSLEFTDPDFDDKDWIEIPELIHLQLLLLEDPYWSEELRRLNDKPWWYRKKFIVPEQYKDELIRIRFEGVDYYTDVWVNGHYLGHHEGGFAPFQFDITNLVNYDMENVIAVKVEAPWDAPNPCSSNPGDRVFRNMAKGLYEHADGLIPPYVNPIGIWRPVKMVISGHVTIDQIKIQTKILESNEAEIEIDITCTNHSNTFYNLEAEICIQGETFSEEVLRDKFFEYFKPKQKIRMKKRYVIENPKLWWPWDQGTPDLYKLTVQLSALTGEIIDKRYATFGIREIKLHRKPNKFFFTVNGCRTFIRGTNYIPDVYLSRMNFGKYMEDMNFVRDCNANLIRVHVHVDRPELYDVCDRLGIMIYQDFELNWLHPATKEWEDRIVPIFRDMINMLYNHPSVVVWCCHNEPSARSLRAYHDANYTQHPDPRLFEEASRLDPTRPAFQCSGQKEEDYLRSGDSHTYLGSLSGGNYQDVYYRKEKFNTEYGIDAPPNLESLKKEPELYERLNHLHDQIKVIQLYQSALIKYYTENYRRRKYNPTGGCIHFMLVDCCPSTFYGILDYYRFKKEGYSALKEAFQPVLISFEYYKNEPKAIWVINDLQRNLTNHVAEWIVKDSEGRVIVKGKSVVEIPADSVKKITDLKWKVDHNQCYNVYLTLKDQSGEIISTNMYHDVFHPPARPIGYERHYGWLKYFDKHFGMRTWGSARKNF